MYKLNKSLTIRSRLTKIMKFKYQNVKDGNLDYCQISGQNNLKHFIDLGSQPLSDTFLDKKDLQKK